MFKINFRAWISFNNLLEPRAAEKIVQSNIHKAKFSKAVNEMNIWQSPIANILNILKKAANGVDKDRARHSSPRTVEKSIPMLTRSKTKLMKENTECDFRSGSIRILRPRTNQKKFL